MSARLIRRSPGLVAALAVTIGLGVGANVAVLGLTYESLVRPSPYEDPGHLVVLENAGRYFYGRAEGEGREAPEISGPDYRDWEDQATAFLGMGAQDPHHTCILTGIDRPRPVRRVFVTARFLDVLAIHAQRGRLFDGSDFADGAPRVALVTEGLWRTHLGSDENVVGRIIRLDDQSFTVIGVLGHTVLDSLERRLGLGVLEDHVTDSVLTPLVTGTGGEAEGYLQYSRAQRDNPWLRVVARLKPGVPLEAARAEMDAIARRLASRYPASNRGRGVRVLRLDTWRTGGIRPLLLMLAGAGALVLLAATGSAAGVILTDGVRRQTEMAVRRALGAGRVRLVRLALVRSVVWCLPGGLLALVFGSATLVLTGQTASAAGAQATRLVAVPWVVAGGALLTALAGVAAGLPEAWHLRTTRMAGALQEGGLAASTGRGRRFALEALVALQIAVTTALVFGAGLLLQSMRNIVAVDPGFDVGQGLVMQVRLPRAVYPDESDQRAFYHRALARIRNLPGVEDAGLTGSAPLTEAVTMLAGGLVVETARGATRQLQGVNGQFVTPGYFEALGLRLALGTSFTEAQYRNDAPVLLVDQAFCRRHLQGSDPLGASIRWGRKQFAVIGVVGDMRQFGVVQEVPPTVYLLQPRMGRARLAFLVVRAFGDPRSIADTVVREAQFAGRAACFDDPRTLESLFAARLAQRRRTVGLVGSSAAIVLLLTTLNLLGVFGHFVASQTREIAIRIALGAHPRHVFGLICGHLGRALGAGICVGVAGGLGLAGALSGHLYGLTRVDPGTLAATMGLVGGLGILAAAVPAWRATRVDPARCLRVE